MKFFMTDANLPVVCGFCFAESDSASFSKVSFPEKNK